MTRPAERCTPRWAIRRYPRWKTQPYTWSTTFDRYTWAIVDRYKVRFVAYFDTFEEARAAFAAGGVQ